MKTSYLFLFISFTLVVLSQEKSENYEILKNLSQEAENVILKVDGKEITFKGEEAKRFIQDLKMVSRLNLMHEDNLIWISDDGDFFSAGEVDSMRVKIFNSHDCDEDIVFLDYEEFEGVFEDIEIDESGEGKKVTITTTENGEKTTKILEGKEADEYLEKMKSDNKLLAIDSGCEDLLIKKAGKHKIIKNFNIKVEESAGKKDVKRIFIKKKKSKDMDTE